MKTAPFDDEAVMDDFVAHVDGRAELRQGAFDDLDGAFYAGAETTGVGEQDFHLIPRAAGLS